MRKNLIKPPKEEKTSGLWKETKSKSKLISTLPIFCTTDDDDYFFEVEDY